MASSPSFAPQPVAIIGFGEAGSAILAGWRALGPVDARAYDIKTDAADPAVRAAKRADYAAAGIDGSASTAEAVAGRPMVVSTVTADQALAAAQAVAPLLAPGAFFIDCNSVAPQTKQAAARAVEAAGGRYVDCAVMAPIHPALHRTPMLLAGPHAAAAEAVMAAMDMQVRTVGDTVGDATAIKMIRSIMVKGLEALTLECVLAGRRAGVSDAVLASLDKTFPGFDWPGRAAYMLERVATHGRRRAAEMEEVALTVRGLGLDDGMAQATVRWQRRIGELGVDARPYEAEPYTALADALSGRLAEAEDQDPKEDVR